VRFLKAHVGQRPLIIRRADISRGIELVCYVDASLGNSVQPYATTGIIITAGGTPMCWWSHKQTRVAHSTEKSEFNALFDAIGTTNFFKTWLKLLTHHVKCRILTDAQNVLDLFSTDYPKPSEKSLVDAIRKYGDKTLVVPAMAVAHSLEDHRIQLVKVGTKLNLADALTKAMDVTAILKSMAGQQPDLITDLPSSLPVSNTNVTNNSQIDFNTANRWARDGVTLRRHVKPPQRYVPGSDERRVRAEN
jgi:hypothetical protein